MIPPLPQVHQYLENVRNDASLVTADVVVLYPCIPHEAGLRAYKETLLGQSYSKRIAINDLAKMKEFVPKSNYFEVVNYFNGKVKQQVSTTVIDTKFAPTYACIFMGVFFIWKYKNEKFDLILKNIKNYHPNIRFTDKFDKNIKNYHPNIIFTHKLDK